MPNQTEQTSSMNGTKISKDKNEIRNDVNDACASSNNVRENVENEHKSNCDNTPKTCIENAATNELCLNEENIKKTRKNGVHAYETIPNGEIKEITDTRKKHSEYMQQNGIQERNGEHQNGLQSIVKITSV